MNDSAALRHSGASHAARHRVPHFCACGQCLCGCKDCAVAYPCCCGRCWSAGIPAVSSHDCTCAPVGALT